MKPCVKCGASDRFPSGACRPCTKRYASRPDVLARARETAASPSRRERKRQGRATEAARARIKELSATPKAKARDKAKALRLKYGLTLEQHAAMLAQQKGLCAVCRDPLLPGHGGTNVDHDHDTGQVRGLLCRGCNSAEGQLKGSALRAERLAAYLRKHAPKLRMVGT